MRQTCVIVAVCAGSSWGQLSFVDATKDLGLDDLSFPHCCFADLNNDGRPDAVVGRNRVFLNVADEASPRKMKFVEVEDDGLPAFRNGDISVFADLDNDGVKDCVWTRYLDINADNYEPPTEGPPKAAWLKGNGDGTFGEPPGEWQVIEVSQEAPTAAVAVGDVDRDGWLDLYLANWYLKYGDDLAGVPNDLIISQLMHWHRDADVPALGRWRATFLPIDNAPFNEESDPGGRPTYGVLILNLLGEPEPDLLDLNYGRRWNSLWRRSLVYFGDNEDAFPGGDTWNDVAEDFGLDGDPIRHGRYPDWLEERAKTDPRFDREDEKPFRSNGNTFDAAVGDIDNDGDFDLFFAEITHAWAGESSDRSRFLVQERDADGAIRFVSPPGLSVDRVPTDPTVRWNQGDIFCELADLDLDGRLDLLLCSSDYPDNQRLRIYRQQENGTFSDITSWVAIDHVGALMPSLADIDADGDLDIMVGQGFTRLRPDQREGREPRTRLYINESADKSLGHALLLRLVGDETKGVSRDALGAIVRVTATIRGRSITQSRQLIGIGGHEGKQMDFALHFGLGNAERAQRVEIRWPADGEIVTVLEDLGAGTHLVRLGESGAEE